MKLAAGALAVLATIAVAPVHAHAATAAPKAGSTCKSSQRDRVVAGMVCRKVGSKFVWQKAPAATTAPAPTTQAPPTPAPLSGKLTVMAPAPLKAFLEAVKASFEAKNPAVSIQLNLAHVPMLLTQLDNGVGADLLLTPDAGSMAQAAGKKLLSAPAANVARIPMALVVPRGNAARVKDVSGLGDELFRVAICAPELPCGKLAQQLASKASVTLKPDTLEPGGSPAIVTKAAAREIDLGLVFATDIAAAGDKVEKIAIPDAINLSADVSVATLNASGNPTLAKALAAFILSPDGAKLAVEAGFLPR